VHDITDLERRGIPGVFVASDVFVDAAASQAKALGCDPASVFVEHPIQDRTDEEIQVIAGRVVEDLLVALQS